ncbi:hypothetical protein, partial [Rhodovulum sulfidophilum]|uniref:hypothetical protein n=1 Tax=Rhodovulum sulfidophilum TaxID=35806 RepID=UPI003075C3DA
MQEGRPHLGLQQRRGQPVALQPVFLGIDRARDIQPVGQSLAAIDGLGGWRRELCQNERDTARIGSAAARRNG